MKLFITGGNGFLGKHVLKELNKTKICYLAPKSSELNILDFNRLCDYLTNNNPDCVLHLSAICGGIIKNSHLPANFLRDNTQMALNIYEAARISNIKRLYSLGSVCSYPKYCPIPFREDDIWNGYPEETNAPYGQAKRTLLLMGQTYRQQYNIGGAHLIPVNLYGSQDSFDDQKSHVMPALIKKFVHAISNNLSQVECLGTGLATREFLFAPDCATAIVRAITMNLDTDLPINLGTGKSISISDLANLIAELTGYQGEIVFKNDGLDGQPNRQLNVERAAQMLNWRAETDLRTGLQQTIEWYRQNRSSMA